MNPNATVEEQIEMAKRSALDSLEAAASAPRYQLPQEISGNGPSGGVIVRRQPAQLEKRSHQMAFSPSPTIPSSDPSVNDDDLTQPDSSPTIPSPPGGTVVLGAIDGNIQWLETNEC